MRNRTTNDSPRLVDLPRKSFQIQFMWIKSRAAFSCPAHVISSDSYILMADQFIYTFQRVLTRISDTLDVP